MEQAKQQEKMLLIELAVAKISVKEAKSQGEQSYKIWQRYQELQNTVASISKQKESTIYLQYQIADNNLALAKQQLKKLQQQLGDTSGVYPPLLSPNNQVTCKV